MLVSLYKEDMKRRVLYPFLNDQSYEYFITNIMKFEIDSSNNEKFIISVPDTFLIRQEYKKREWHQSVDRKFGVFFHNEEWKIVFQGK